MEISHLELRVLESLTLVVGLYVNYHLLLEESED